VSMAEDASAAGWAELPLNQHYSCSPLQGKEYFMSHRMLSKMIVFQCSLSLLNGQGVSSWKDPLVAFLEADAAVTFCYCGEFWELDAEFEGPAVAVAVVGFELWGGSWGCHDGNEKQKII